MQFDYAVLADHAEIASNKLYLMGGGWDTYRVASLPHQVRIAIAVGVRVEWHETNSPTRVVVTFDDEDGLNLANINGTLNVGRPAHLPPGSSQLAQMAVNVALSFSAFGGYRVRITAEREGSEPIATTIPFRVIEAQANN